MAETDTVKSDLVSTLNDIILNNIIVKRIQEQIDGKTTVWPIVYEMIEKAEKSVFMMLSFYGTAMFNDENFKRLVRRKLRQGVEFYVCSPKPVLIDEELYKKEKEFTNGLLELIDERCGELFWPTEKEAFMQRLRTDIKKTIGWAYYILVDNKSALTGAPREINGQTKIDSVAFSNIGKNDHVFFYESACYYREKGELDLAILYGETARRLKKDDPDILNNLGYYYLSKAKCGIAKIEKDTHYDCATAICLSRANLSFLCASILREEKLTKLEKCKQQIAEKGGEDLAERIRLAESEIADEKKALANTYNNLGDCFVYMGLDATAHYTYSNCFRTAIEQYAEVLKLDPEHKGEDGISTTIRRKQAEEYLKSREADEGHEEIK